MSRSSSSGTLALLGGNPVRKRPWPEWPRADENTERLIRDVLRSGRWAISGMYNGTKLYERRFGEAFAAYHDVPYCVATASGSAALTIGLESLGVGDEDEVLVPGLTWVACASAVAAIGGTPILVDVDPQTLCLSAGAARQAITERTKAIMLVHLYCTVADLDEFQALSEETGIPILEDCSQAHGAAWRGRKVGTFGRVGVFSMQDSKVLTSGEGGAVITSDPVLFDRLQQLRADGRRYLASPPPVGYPELEEVGMTAGRNLCLSEFQSAILLDRLGHLDEENRLREQNADYLRQLLTEIGGITPLHRPAQADAITYYQFCARLDLEAFGASSVDQVRQALMAELHLYLDPVDSPLNDNLIYNPLLSPRLKPRSARALALDPRRFALPIATQAKRECLTLPHKALLGDRTDLEEIAAAFSKVKENHQSLSRVRA